MKIREEVPQRRRVHTRLSLAAAELAGAWRRWTPTAARRFVRLAQVHWRLLVLLLGFTVQGVLVWEMWQLVDLVLDLMEVWAQLARKHLEIVLS